MPTILIDEETRKALAHIRNMLLGQKITTGALLAVVTWNEAIKYLIESYNKGGVV